jgi:hypothetical protein
MNNSRPSNNWIIAVDHAYANNDETAYMCRACAYFSNKEEDVVNHKCWEPIICL